MNIITIRCTQRWYIEKLIGLSMRHRDTGHVPETGAWGTATIALTWVLSIAYIINACDCAGARHGIRGAVRGAFRGRLRTEHGCAHLRGRGPAEWRGSGALPDPGCAPTAAGPQTNRTPSDIGLSCHLPKMTVNRRRKCGDDCPQSLNSRETRQIYSLSFPKFCKYSLTIN